MKNKQMTAKSIIIFAVLFANADMKDVMQPTKINVLWNKPLKEKLNTTFNISACHIFEGGSLYKCTGKNDDLCYQTVSVPHLALFVKNISSDYHHIRFTNDEDRTKKCYAVDYGKKECVIKAKDGQISVKDLETRFTVQHVYIVSSKLINTTTVYRKENCTANCISTDSRQTLLMSGINKKQKKMVCFVGIPTSLRKVYKLIHEYDVIDSTEEIVRVIDGNITTNIGGFRQIVTECIAYEKNTFNYEPVDSSSECKETDENCFSTHDEYVTTIKNKPINERLHIELIGESKSLQFIFVPVDVNGLEVTPPPPTTATTTTTTDQLPIVEIVQPPKETPITTSMAPTLKIPKLSLAFALQIFYHFLFKLTV